MGKEPCFGRSADKKIEEPMATRSPDRPRGAAVDAIYDAATRLFVEKGVDRASLSDIAQEAGVSKGTLHYHFATKNDLIFAIAERHMEALTAEFASLLAHRQMALDALMTHFFKVLVGARTRGRLHLHLVREAVVGSPEIRERIRAAYTGWQARFEGEVARFFPEGEGSAVIARTAIAIVDGMLIQELVGLEAVDSGELARLVMAGMAG